MLTASEFAYNYEIKDRAAISGELKYKDINALYKNKRYTYLTLSFNSTGTRLKNNDDVLKETQEKFIIPIPRSIMEGKQNFIFAKVEMLNPGNKELYESGIDFMKKHLGVTILPPQQQPWYKKYWAYLLGALGVCVGTYCYVKYTQTGSGK